MIENRPFSGPTSAADRPLNEAVKVDSLPTAQQLTDVLNFFKQAPEEFQKLTESITSENEHDNETMGVTVTDDQ